MGYTNYYTTKNVKTFPIDFVNGVKKIVEKSPCKLCGWDNTDITSVPEISTTHISLNGCGGDGHESFVLNADEGGFNFCKTARKPYDVIVKAILIYAEKFNLLEEEFSFDGDKDEEEYTNAVNYLKTLTL